MASQETAFLPAIVQHAAISTSRAGLPRTDAPRPHTLTGRPSDSHTQNRFRTSLSSADAVAKIASFRALSHTHAHLHPDSVLSAGGINFSATGGREGGLVMHYLSRIERGLAGEDMGAAPNQADFESSAEGLITAKKDLSDQSGGDAMEIDDAGAGGEARGWVDASDFAQEEEEAGQDLSQ